MMETINELLYRIGVETVETVWLPLAAWTMLALPIFLWLRGREQRHPVVRYHVQRALMLSLPLGIAAVNMFDVSRWIIPPALESAGRSAETSVVVLLPMIVEDVSVSSVSWGIYHGLGILSLMAVMLAFWQLVKLVGGAGRLAWYSRGRIGWPDDHVQSCIRDLTDKMDMRRKIRAVVTSENVSPMTFGWYRPMIVIPQRIAEDEERLQMTLVHELTHIRRNDYLWHWAERVTEACVAVHPLVYRLRREINALREMVCDAEVIDILSCSRHRYALLLYETVVPEDGEDSFVVAMSESGKNLKRRIQAMKNFTEQTERFMTPQRLGFALGSFLMMSAIFVVSCTDFVEPEEPSPDVQASEQTRTAEEVSDDPEVFVAVEEMPELQGGIHALVEEVRYPEQARQAGVEGQVIVQFVVDEQGNVVDPKILRGIGAGCDEEALRVVRQAEFTPGLQQGDPVRVKMSLPVRFALSESS